MMAMPTSYSATYHQGTATLQLYTHHVTASKGPREPPEYYMSHLNSYTMYGDINTFREGAGALRNNRDRAKTDRDKLINHANQIVRGAPFADAAPTTLTDGRTSLSMLQEDESDTSTDEISAVQTTAKRTRHAPVEKSGAGTMPSTATSYSTRPLIREPAISRQSTTDTHYVLSGTRSRPLNDDGKSRRQIRPTRKIMENTLLMEVGVRDDRVVLVHLHNQSSRQHGCRGCRNMTGSHLVKSFFQVGVQSASRSSGFSSSSRPFRKVSLLPLLLSSNLHQAYTKRLGNSYVNPSLGDGSCLTTFGAPDIHDRLPS